MDFSKRITGPIRWEIERDMAPFGKKESALSPRQRTSLFIVAAKLHELRYELLPYPVYSPDLTSYDLFLFPNINRIF